MKKRLINLLHTIRATYWFIPAVLAVSAVILSYLLPFFDHLIIDQGGDIPGWIYGGGPSGARTLLSTIAGSMITVASLTFSITLAALSTASQQFGPRLLNNFMRDRGYQVVLGTFVANFLYGILVLRQIRDVNGEVVLPRVAVSFSVVLAIAALALLIYFFHHAAASIKADELISRVGDDLIAAIDRSSRRDNDSHAGMGCPPEEAEDNPGADRQEKRSLLIRALESGYIQSIDDGLLSTIAAEEDMVFRVERRLGEFLIKGSTLLEASPLRRMDEDVREKIYEAFSLGTYRFLPGEIEVAVNELVEIALRALSPSMNDPNTAIACIDQLARGLEHKAAREIDSPHTCRTVEGEVRLITARLSFGEMVDASFDRIRNSARGMPCVSARMLEVILSLSSHVHEATARAALLRQADMIGLGSEDIREPNDRRRVLNLHLAVRRAIQGE